jgi:hypothetical protein
MFPFIITLAIAIWRYRLFDIDLIIRRTLVYSLLTGLLSLLYFSGVALLQAILTADRGRLTAGDGRRPPSAVVIVVTTSHCCLFNPLRRKLGFIDGASTAKRRRACQVHAYTRSETDINFRYIKHPQKTLQPAQVNLWLVKTHPKARQAEKRILKLS